MTEFQEPTITARRPDVNSAEAILYGKEYLSQKSADWFWDAVEDQLKKELEENKRRIRDPEFAAMVLKNRPNMIFARNPPVSNVNQLRDLQILKLCVKNGTAIRDIQVRRTNNELYSRMKGIAQYTERMMQDGVSDSTWKVATNGKNEPITYDSIRRLLDDDEMKAEADAKEFSIQLDRYKADKDRFALEMEEYRRSIDEGREYVPPEVETNDFNIDEEQALPDIPIYREIINKDAVRELDEEQEEMVDPNSDLFWGYEDEEPIIQTYNMTPLYDDIRTYLTDWYPSAVSRFLAEVGA